MRSFAVFCCLVFSAVLLFPVGVAAPGDNGAAIIKALNEDSGWSHFDSNSGVEVYSKPVPGEEVKAYKGVRLLPTGVDAAALFETIADVENHEHTSDSLIDSKVVWRSGDDSVFYQVTKKPMPPVAQRYWVNFARSERNIGGVVNHSRRSWRVADPLKYADTLNSLKANYPDAVRVEKTFGSWEVKPIEGGRHQLIYRNFTLPGGSAPAYLFERVSRARLPDNMLRFEARSQKGGQ